MNHSHRSLPAPRKTRRKQWKISPLANGMKLAKRIANETD
jgi:hypothetical protein